VHTANHYFTEKPKSKMSLGEIRINIKGKSFRFLTASGVFSKKRVDLGTCLLIESMVLPDEGYVLDIGCGYGAVGIAAAVFKPNLRVIMVDVNERAVWLANKNMEINHVRNAEVRKGFLYEPVMNLKFNCILLNPPVSAGMATVKAIIAEAPKYLTAKANFQMVVKSKIGGKRIQTFFKEVFGNVKVHARRSGYRVLLAEKQ